MQKVSMKKMEMQKLSNQQRKYANNWRDTIAPNMLADATGSQR